MSTSVSDDVRPKGAIANAILSLGSYFPSGACGKQNCMYKFDLILWAPCLNAPLAQYSENEVDCSHVLFT